MYNRFDRTIEDKMSECRKFLEALHDILKDDFVLMPSCNQDLSAYLVPNGTEEDVSYYGKPINSFRISDHWNWYSNLRRCTDPNMIQCPNIDIPWCRRRKAPGMPTQGLIGVQVAYYGADNRYHCVFGEKFDRKTKQWMWVNSTPEKAAELVTA